MALAIDGFAMINFDFFGFDIYIQKYLERNHILTQGKRAPFLPIFNDIMSFKAFFFWLKCFHTSSLK